MSSKELGSILYRSKKLTLFGNAIFVACFAGPPSRKSEDEDACEISALFSEAEGIGIRLRIRTGVSVDSYWPDFDMADIEWVAPVAEVEKAILEIIVAE
ncbi:hypothetical protein [Falsihalocynthiibacter sp. BN13B15]|uniref:hypothetical protein n=1 Tax=Falsihalocynthiibacter sp. BN13B15 TaxID=3240871 RepID=UPI00350FB9E3